MFTYSKKLEVFQLCSICLAEYTFINLVISPIERGTAILSVPRLSSILRYWGLEADD